MATRTQLADLGWSPFFERQLGSDGQQSISPGRITRVQRSGVTVSLEFDRREVALGGRWYRGAAEQRPTVGDWVAFDSESGRIVRVLQRKSLLKRLVPGSAGAVQLLGANIDTLFVVTSCDAEFNPSRLERYLSLARQGDVRPVLILTKRDLTRDAARYGERAANLEEGLPVHIVNAHDRNSLQGLLDWCRRGQTVAMMGSSGVGKSTLLNTLCGGDIQATGTVRADRKGRHTTTSRSLHPLPSGGLLLDSPGTRELQLAGSNAVELFDDVERFARGCRFADCAHATEPDCAVREAVRRGDLHKRRLTNYLKLKREEAAREEWPARA